MRGYDDDNALQQVVIHLENRKTKARYVRKSDNVGNPPTPAGTSPGVLLGSTLLSLERDYIGHSNINMPIRRDSQFT